MKKSQMIDNVREMARSHCLADIHTIDKDGNVLWCEDGFIAFSQEFKNRFFVFEHCSQTNGGFLYGEQSNSFDAIQIQFATIWKENDEIIDAKVFISMK